MTPDDAAAAAVRTVAEPETLDVPLPDGRTLEVAVSGPEDGRVFLWHHGTPGCAHQSVRARRTAHGRGLRLVTYSRAGAGRSTRDPGRSVADVAADMAAVLDHLGVERCLTGGGSGGGPHTLATGALLPDRVDGVLCFCGVRPYGDPGDSTDDGEPGFLDGMGQDNLDEFGLALQGEEALRPYLMEQREGILRADPEEAVAQMESLLPPVDRAVLTGEVGVDILTGLQGGVERVDGWLDDDLAFTKPWGFELADVRVPTYLWQGTEDLMVPANHADYLASRLPGATVHIEPGEGHLSINVARMGDALDEALAGLAG